MGWRGTVDVIECLFDNTEYPFPASNRPMNDSALLQRHALLHADLNEAQRAATTFGVNGEADTPPLLIIAGAGSGKTKTLTHRVAHLILNGADPRRILLMTFARRMAAEMTRRVEHICARAFHGRGTVPADAVEWS